jgi:peptidoglycan/LPS O-acetylase OafA/YrhL
MIAHNPDIYRATRRGAQMRCTHLGFMMFPLIDVIRAAAALLVLMYHFVTLGQWSPFPESLWTAPIRYGWIGVDLFLVVSGFVITLSAARARLNHPQAFRWSFMQRRLWRIVPLYAVSCTVYIFLVRPELLLGSPTGMAYQLFSHALFVQNLSPHSHGVINGVTWSLALEMQFYIALILSIGWLVRLGAMRTLALLVGIAWAWRYGTTFFLIPGEAATHLQFIYTTQLPGTLDAFGMGIALALVVFNGQGFWADRLKPGWGNSAMWLALATVLLALSGKFLTQNGGDYWSLPGMVIFWRTSLAMGFGASLATILTCPLTGAGILRPFRYLGQISYGIYLWHLPVLLALLTQPTLRGSRLLVCTLIGAISLASLSWHLMERHWVAPSRERLKPGL